MKFLKTAPSQEPAELAAAVERLNAIVERGQAELRLYPRIEEPEGVERRFWTPDELAEANHCA